MSLSNSMANALTGLNANSRMAEIVSSNLSNALTEGYGRRQVALSAQSVAGRGAGVRIDGVERVLDRATLTARRNADSELAGQTANAAMLVRLETLIGGIGSGDTLADRVDALAGSLIAASADPSSSLRLADVDDSLGGLTRALNTASDGIVGLRGDADQSIATQVETLNSSLATVERLNADITRALNTGADSLALVDQRQVMIDRIAEIVPLREMTRSGGQVALISAKGTILIDGRAAEFGFVPATSVDAASSMSAGGLSGLTFNGDPVLGAPGIGKLGGGSLGATFELRDTVLVEAQADVDAVARDLIERFAAPGVDPSSAPGAAGLLTDAGAPLDPADTVGLAGRISVNAAVDPAQGGALWRLRDGLGAAVEGPVGSALQIGAWLDALDASRPGADGGPDASAAGLAGRVTAGFGQSRVAAEQALSFGTARRDVLHQAELANGVDSDHEMQMLLRIEQAYAANARLIQTVQSMIQTLMEI